MLKGKLSAGGQLGGSLSASDGLGGTLTTGGKVYPVYGGVTIVTPSGSAQVLATEGTAVLADIVVNPIPSNYGLITWDGSTLNVS